MTREERIKAINEKIGNAKKFEKELNVGRKEGIIRAGGQGLAFGFGDELEALYKSRVQNKNYEEELKKSRDKLKSFRETNPVEAYGSEIVGSIPSSIGGAGLVAKAGLKGVGKVGALQGGIYGAGTGETAEDRGKQALVTGALGGGVSKLASKILPKTTELAKKFLRNDVNLTGGQMVKGSGAFGDLVGGIEASSTSIPGVGVAISQAKTRALSDFNKFAMLEALEPILDKSSKKILKAKLAKVDGTDAYNIVDEFMQKQYSDVLGDINFGPNAIVALEDDVITTIINSEADEAGKDLVLRAINQIFSKKLKVDPKTGDKFLSGQDYKRLESELFRLQKNYFKKEDFDTDRIAETFQLLRSVFKNATDSTVGGPKLRKINMAFARLNPIGEAVLSANRTRGIFTTSQLLNSLKKVDVTKGKKITKTGKDPMTQLAREGEELLGQVLPDSGTASRLIAGEGAISPSNLLRYAVPTLVSKGLYNMNVPRGIFNAPNVGFQGLKNPTLGLLSGETTNRAEGLLNRGNQ